jgi:hypothetical protein
LIEPLYGSPVKFGQVRVEDDLVMASTANRSYVILTSV